MIRVMTRAEKVDLPNGLSNNLIGARSLRLMCNEFRTAHRKSARMLPNPSTQAGHLPLSNSTQSC